MTKTKLKKALITVCTAFCVSGVIIAQPPGVRVVQVQRPQPEITQPTPEPVVETKPVVKKSSGSIQERLADLISELPQTVVNNSLYKVLSDWMGVRYQLGGTSKSGIDCSAFVQKVYQNVFGVNVVRTAFEQFNSVNKTPTNKLKEGDLVFFKIKSSRITHVGIYLTNNYFVHSSSSKGVTISNLNEPYWARYYAGGGVMAKGALNINQEEIDEVIKEAKKKL